jgi:hypothetical protein
VKGWPKTSKPLAGSRAADSTTSIQVGSPRITIGCFPVRSPFDRWTSGSRPPFGGM